MQNIPDEPMDIITQEQLSRIQSKNMRQKMVMRGAFQAFEVRFGEKHMYL